MLLRLTAALTLAAGLVAGAAPRPLDDATLRHVLSRLTFGVRPGDADRLRAMGYDAWLDRQLHPQRVDDRAVEARLAPLTTLTLDSRTIVQDWERPAREERRARKAAPADAPDAPGAADPEPEKPGPAQMKYRQVVGDLEQAKLLRAVYSERQLQEVLVDVWFNHFNVFAGKGATRDYLTEYERDVIRPRVFGRFRDLLGATAASPAMLFYLDNWQNVDPAASTRFARLRSRVRARRGAAAPADAPAPPPRGLNENFARELMELHTLGVDGGYTQQDVVEVARAFTGWTMRPREGSGFVFVPALHVAGPKLVLGHRIDAGGRRDGEQVLDILAAHPSTARHIATMLVTRFVNDTPPPALVDRVARRFLETDGDLREVTRAVLTSPEFFDAANRGARVKTPLEFVTSALRATNAEVTTPLPLVRTLREMGMPPYFCQPPTGYATDAATWLSPGALVARMNFAAALGANRVRGVRVAPVADRAAFVDAAIGDRPAPATARAIADATTPAALVAATLGAPDFQHR
ncbi:MAG: DUF1800 domain-containing protein [Vicinamibacterales bacterium]